jgi:hypothetical protein
MEMKFSSALVSLAGEQGISTFLKARHICLTQSTMVECLSILEGSSSLIAPVSTSKMRLVIPLRNAGMHPFFRKLRKDVESIKPCARDFSKSRAKAGREIVRNEIPSFLTRDRIVFRSRKSETLARHMLLESI